MQNTVKNNYKCDICGREGQRKIYHSNEYLLLCPSCSEQLHTCRGCAHRENCLLELNPLGLEKVMLKTIRQGQQVISIQVPNPQLFDSYCKQCRCNDTISNSCMRQYCGYCTKWELHPDYTKEE